MASAASYATSITPYPEWLLASSWVFLSLSFLCAVIIVVDERRRPQNMTIMNFVWPITAIYFGPAALWGYFRSRPKVTRQHYEQMQREVREELRIESESRPIASGQVEQSRPTREQVAVARIAHAGARGISKVEVQVDDGPWHQAVLRTPLSQWTWVIWRYDWPFQSGTHTLTVRCYEGNGTRQIVTPSPAEPNGATGLYSKSLML